MKKIMKLKLDKQGKIILSETQIKRQIKSYLKLKRVFFWWNLQGLGCYPGLPDLMGILDDGRFFVVEVKRPGGTLSAKQVTFLNNCDERKTFELCTTSFEIFRD